MITDPSIEMRKINESATKIKGEFKQTPSIGIVLGSGLGGFVDILQIFSKIPYSTIPHFHATSVEGHNGILYLAQLQNHPNSKLLAILQGRYHYYEGYPMEDVVRPIRVLRALGIQDLLLTNSSGSCNPHYSAGDFMIIKDHINLFGTSPLIGRNLKELGNRFPDMTQAYDLEIQEKINLAANKLGIKIHRGIYGGLHGPNYETPAEISMLYKSFGIDCVGMSTVPETIAARHMGMRVGGISLISNKGAGLSGKTLSHEEVQTESTKKTGDFSRLLQELILLMNMN